MRLPPALDDIAASFPHPMVFATVSGAHLYGFPSPDSDYDLRGCHVLPVEELIGLREPDLTTERFGREAGLELDLVSHDVRKFCRMLLDRNGYVLEQLLSPWIVRTSAAHAELAALAPDLVTRNHAHHYLGFARNQWRMFAGEPRVKSLLYVYRVLLTGIHLMETGEVLASLPRLLECIPQEEVDGLIATKTASTEGVTMAPDTVRHHAKAVEALLARLEQARDRSPLRERAAERTVAALNELAVRVRLRGPG